MSPAPAATPTFEPTIKDELECFALGLGEAISTGIAAVSDLNAKDRAALRDSVMLTVKSHVALVLASKGRK